jgi:hypothetical protein
VLISCGGEFVDPEGRAVGTFGLNLPSCSPHEFWRALLIRSYVAKPTVVARRSRLLAVGGFNEGLTIAEDQDMWIRLALSGDVGFVTEVLVRVHETPDSLMKRYGNREDEFGLVMLRNNLARAGARLSKREIRHILSERYVSMGQNIYAQGRHRRGTALVIRGVLLGNQPLRNLGYLISAAPLTMRLKQHIRARGGGLAIPLRRGVCELRRRSIFPGAFQTRGVEDHEEGQEPNHTASKTINRLR